MADKLRDRLKSSEFLLVFLNRDSSVHLVEPLLPLGVEVWQRDSMT
jgi:hypothetical protein